VLQRILLPALLVLVAGLSLEHASVANGTVPINFVRGTVAGAGFATTSPTALAIGPDGRLYVADGSGKIQALSLDPTTKAVTAVQQITTATDLQEVYGIAFDPSDNSSPPPIYVTDTVSGFGDSGQAPAGSFLGKVTKISGPGYATRTDIITGLPVTNSGHEANALRFGPDGRLYIAQGSTTNGGVVNPNPGIFQRPDVPTSGAILVADIKAPGFNGNITYSPPNTYSDTLDQTGGDVSVYAPGFRNPYGLVFHSNGKFYATDNGSNAGYGPASTSCTTQGAADAAALDELDLVQAGNYYGHPNRNRGRTDPRQCVYHPGTEASNGGYTGPIESNLPASSDGIAEYTSNKFGGQMQGDLLYAAWVNSELHRLKLSADGLSVVSDTTLASGLQNALDVAVDADGTIYVAEYGGNKITFFKPDETPVSAITVGSITQNAGPVSGGQAVTITGTNFTTSAETAVTIGGQAVTNVVVQNSTTITATTPANTVGAKDVVVANSIGTATLTGGYTYAAGGGTIPPVAKAGNDITAPVSHLNHAHVTLDGSASYDPDGFIVSYNWSEAGITISSAVKETVELTEGVHDITLTVTDNDGLSSSDNIRVNITSGPQNLNPYFCADVDGDGSVTILDLANIAMGFGKKFGQPGYTRMRDRDMDRSITILDLSNAAGQFHTTCSVEDELIRSATIAMEPYQNVNAALAAGYVQVTQFIPQQGRHLVKSSLFDTVFDPTQPEGLLYEPDPSTPGGWRLGGALYYMPISLNPNPPDGFPGTTDDAWHLHDFLCFYPNGTVTLDAQDVCTAQGGSYQTNVGWMVHLWNYVPSVPGRYIEDNPGFVGLP
jgi:glucose/arabinose dehydrogenase